MAFYMPLEAFWKPLEALEAPWGLSNKENYSINSEHHFDVYDIDISC